jgi:alkylhydroperoxidase/carboxymuconolactone decarboxylase family protein YurZ
MDPRSYRKGQDTYRRVFGHERDMSEALEFDYLTVEHVYGRIWSRTRGGLSLPDRSFITVAVNAALRREQELAIHLRAARSQGLTGEQVLAILLLVGEVAGAEALAEALRVVRTQRPPIAMRALTPWLAPEQERLVRLALLAACGTEAQVRAFHERRKRELKGGAARAKYFALVVEVMIHVAHYAGWPAGHNGLRPARAAFPREYRAALGSTPERKK